MLTTRQIQENDWEFIPEWHKQYPDWPVLPRDAYPENGLGGLVVSNDGVPFAAGFVYLSNSSICWVDWIISDNDYREDNRDEGIELLIANLCSVAKNAGGKFVLTIVNTPKLIDKYKNQGFIGNETPSYELTKIL